ncbi:hypothetical protein [Flexivirga sp.]|uniref:hypothetical protein n=1 Tax=Flexivirga sp. TaxID=1962927 RepID=UPI003F815431
MSLLDDVLTGRVCGTCGTTGGGGTVLIITRGRNGDHYEPTPCPTCGTRKAKP